MTTVSSFRSYWKAAVVKYPDRPLLKLARSATGQVLNYRVRSLFSRAHKFASGFKALTDLGEGARIAVLVKPSDTLAFILHGAWLLRMTVVYIDWQNFASSLTREFKDLEVDALIVDEDLSYKIAMLLKAVPSLKHYFVVGDAHGIEAVRRFDGLLQGGSDQSIIELLPDTDCEALILYGQEDQGEFYRSVFTQSSLCLQAELWTQHFPTNDQDDQLAYVGSCPFSFESVFFNFVAPLFSGVPFLLHPDLDIRRFWEHVRSDILTWTYISQVDLQAILRRGKPSLWEKPEDLLIYVGSDQPLAIAVLQAFQDKFEMFVYPCLVRTDLGGFISIFPQNLGVDANLAWLYQQVIPSSGILLEHIEVKFVDEFEIEVLQGIRGRLWVRYKGEKEWVDTGLDGFFAEDNKDRAHIFIDGAHVDGVFRFGEYINLARIDAAIRSLKGISFGMAVGFSNDHAGVEIGAYIVPLDLATMQFHDHEYLEQLQDLLSYEESPKVIVRGSSDKASSNKLTRESVLSKFKKFKKLDYSKG